MDNGSSTGSGGAGRAFVRLLVTLVVLGLIGTVVLLLGQLNARTFSLQKKGDTLVAMKGRPIPYGVAPFTPEDKATADTYAPIPLEGREPNPAYLNRRFEDRDELDRALFKILEELARARIDSENPKELEQAVLYIRRATRLPGVSDEQRTSLAQLEAQVAYFRGRSKLEDARQLTTDAVGLLRLAAASRSRDARAALALLAEVEPVARVLERTLGRATQLLDGSRDDEPGRELPSPVPSPAPATPSWREPAKSDAPSVQPSSPLQGPPQQPSNTQGPKAEPEQANPKGSSAARPVLPPRPPPADDATRDAGE